MKDEKKNMKDMKSGEKIIRDEKSVGVCFNIFIEY